MEFFDGSTAAVGVLRAGVEHEALASVDALEGSVQLGSVVQKLARLMCEYTSLCFTSLRSLFYTLLHVTSVLCSTTLHIVSLRYTLC